MWQPSRVNEMRDESNFVNDHAVLEWKFKIYDRCLNISLRVRQAHDLVNTTINRQQLLVVYSDTVGSRVA